jgi:hypothetical protein
MGSFSASVIADARALYSADWLINPLYLTLIFPGLIKEFSEVLILDGVFKIYKSI